MKTDYNDYCIKNSISGEKIKNRLIKYESFSSKPYYDNLYLCTSKGHWTWGYGTTLPITKWFNLMLGEDVKISEKQAENYMEKYIIDAHKMLKKSVGNNISKINNVRTEALIDMIYNIGGSRFWKFKKLRAQLMGENIDWYKVSKEVMQSLYYTKHPARNRVNRVINELRNGI